MAWWVIPAMIASAGVTIMGIQQQKKNLRANRAWQDYENQLNYNYEKQKRLTEEKKLLSEQRARAGASGAQMFTGSSLLVAQADLEEFENDMWYLEKGLWSKTQAQDAALAGEIANANFAIGQTLFSTAASAGQYQQNEKLLASKGNSDIRLKENIKLIRTMPNGINVYEWDWNEIGENIKADWQPNHGVMAQELLDVLPEAIGIDEFGYFVVDYSHPDLIGVLQ